MATDGRFFQEGAVNKVRPGFFVQVIIFFPSLSDNLRYVREDQ